ncbi:MAG TPA: NlpC/P60 family protein [Verrucomicrobiae bacterium]|nr:NlpC/P60 family protein [Verrucomicrobiae bacterium]
MLKYKRFLGAIAIISILGLPMNVRAESLEQQLDRYQGQYDHLKKQYAQQKKQESEAASRVLGLQQSISVLNADINAKKAAIAAQQKELNELERKQKELGEQKLEREKQLGAFLRNNYETGTGVYLDTLLSAKSLNDLFDRIEVLRYIVKKYDQIQAEIKQLTADIKSQQDAAKQKEQALQETLRQKTVAQESLNRTMQQEKTLLANLSAQEKDTLNKTSQAQRNISYVQDLIRQEQIDEENAKRDPVHGGGSAPGITTPVKLNGTVAQLIDYAESFIGTPYVWGGTTPNPGFDCSGFVQYVFRHYGINLARVSEDQYNEGIPVSRDQLMPGDLVFFHTYNDGRGPSSPTHIGIYVGNGNMVDSESRGVLVTSIFTNSYWAPRYLGAKRVIAP